MLYRCAVLPADLSLIVQDHPVAIGRVKIDIHLMDDRIVLNNVLEMIGT